MNLSENDLIEIKSKNEGKKRQIVEVTVNGSQDTLTTMLYSAMTGNSVLADIILAAASSYVMDRIEQEQKARLN